MTIARQIDLRAVPAPQSDRDVFDSFDGLAPGDAVVVTDRQRPADLLQRLQSERAGRFEWNVLEAGPATYRVEVARRADEGPRAVTEWLEADHRRLDGILLEALRLADDGAFAQACARFDEFACGLDRHIDIEEGVLFPIFEKATGMTGGPTEVMRFEHVRVRQHMDAIAAALDAGNAAAAHVGAIELEGTLCPHNMKEENILYPLIDRVAGDERGRDDLVRRCQAL